MSEHTENTPGPGADKPEAPATGVGLGAGEPSTFEPEEDPESVPEDPAG